MGSWKSRKAGTGTETETGTENWERSSGALVILVQIGYSISKLDQESS